MKIQKVNQINRKGFTLIEMIGVLAVIAILLALLVPKIFETINSARVNNAAIGCNTVKAAVADHYGKFGGLAIDGTKTPPVAILPAALPVLQYDLQLMQEGLLEKLFTTKIGEAPGPAATRVELTSLAAAVLGHAIAAAGTGEYDLDNDGAKKNDVVGSVVVQAIITGVAETDAMELSRRIDGDSMTTAIGTSDLVGRVQYATGSPTTVYIYITHR